MNNLKTKIDARLNHLQQLMEGQAHIDRPEYVQDVIGSITKFWTALDEADRDYIECSKYALEKRLEWNVKNINQ